MIKIIWYHEELIEKICYGYKKHEGTIVSGYTSICKCCGARNIVLNIEELCDSPLKLFLTLLHEVPHLLGNYKLDELWDRIDWIIESRKK